MTVGDLIKHLHDFDWSMPVAIEGYEASTEDGNKGYILTHVDGQEDGEGYRRVILWGMLRKEPSLPKYEP